MRGDRPTYSRQKKPRAGAWKVFVTLCAVLVLCAAALTRMNRRNGDGGWLPGAGVEVPEYVEQDFLPVNDYSRPGRSLEKINGVVIHYVGNPGSSARANRDYFASLASGRDGTYASSHFIVGLNGEVVQCVPLTEVSYASNGRNGDTVAIEVCHPDAEGKFSDTTYGRLMDLTAWLCMTFDLDPAEDVIRHYDVTGKECPRYYVRNPAAWEQLRLDAASRLERLRWEQRGTA